MNGWPRCPKCGEGGTALISTTNEWQYVCDHCDIRFRTDGTILARSHTIREATIRVEDEDMNTPSAGSTPTPQVPRRDNINIGRD